MSAQQPTCVPPTVEELLATYRSRLACDLEDAVGRAVKANTKADEARETLSWFDAAMAAQQGPLITYPSMGTGGFIGDIMEHPPFGDDRDPEDGMTDAEAAVFENVAPPATITTDVDVTCADCGGEGRLPDRTGGGQHKCKACAGTGSLVKHVTLPAVGVFRPGDDFPTITDVGPLTRFGELIADYLTESASEDEIADYHICSADDGTELDPKAQIMVQDYGRQFVVERRASEMAVSSTGSGQIGDAMPSKGDDGSDASAAPESPAAS